MVKSLVCLLIILTTSASWAKGAENDTAPLGPDPTTAGGAATFAGTARDKTSCEGVNPEPTDYGFTSNNPCQKDVPKQDPRVTTAVADSRMPAVLSPVYVFTAAPGTVVNLQFLNAPTAAINPAPTVNPKDKEKHTK